MSDTNEISKESKRVPRLNPIHFFIAAGIGWGRKFPTTAIVKIMVAVQSVVWCLNRSTKYFFCSLSMGSEFSSGSEVMRFTFLEDHH